MLITRKIGTLIRGKATPFQIFATCILGSMLGFLPGFAQAPGMFLFWGFLLLILNANIFLAGIVALLGKLIFLLTMPVLFQIGRLLLEGPTQGIFKALVNAPVTAYSGLDYYVVAGGQLVGLVAGIALGGVCAAALQRYRRKMADLSQNSERLKSFQERKWAKALKFVFLGSGKGKSTYEELMEKRVGNPIRIWGAAVVLIACVLLYFGFSALAGPLMTSLAKSGLESANGATVDVESVALSLADGKLEARGLAMADPNALETNLFAARRIVADVDAADLMRKRFSLDLVTFEDAATGSVRETPGSIVGPAPKAEGGTFELPDFSDIDGVLENSKVWKERLAQAKRWLNQLGGGEDAEEKKVTWKEELNSRIQSVGYAHVKADFLTEGSPTFLVRRLEAMGVATPYLDQAKLDIIGTDLSTHPALVPNPPKISVVSANGRLDASLALGGASGTGLNQLAFLLKDYPVDAFAKNIKTSGEPPLSGGTMDIDLSGALGAVANDLVAQVTFADSTARIGGKPVSLNGLTLPVQIKGPLDQPAIKLESKALEKILVSAGKQKLLEEATKKLGLGGDDANADGKKQDTKTEAKNILEGLLNKKKSE